MRSKSEVAELRRRIKRIMPLLFSESHYIGMFAQVQYDILNWCLGAELPRDLIKDIEDIEKDLAKDCN